MSDSLLLFTFSPIQSFIQEARRAEDLFNGSAILSELAKAAANGIGEYHLIYPAPPFGGDLPNVLVAQLPDAQAKAAAENAKSKLEARWKEIANDALKRMIALKIPTDQTWIDIWDQQVNPENLWEVYWAVVPIGGTGYAEAYRQASRAVDALKRSRIFKPMEETGQKDSLSGKRAALVTAGYKKARDYWKAVAELDDVFPSKVRPDGRERLDAIGAVKRFAELRNEPFDSTSTVAAADFLARARADAKTKLDAYHKLLQQKFTEKEVFRPYKKVHSKADWTYDGDLLYGTTLTVERFKSDYHFHFNDKDPQIKQKEKELADKLQECRDLLTGNKTKNIEGIYSLCGEPSPYYAIIVLDGDSMGTKIDELLQETNAQDLHKKFSEKLREFSEQVGGLVDAQNGFLVYNGGDDVMCMAPLSNAIPLALSLRNAFRDTMAEFKVTACAGIAISHHQSPLDFAIEEARNAEKAAKKVKDKDAICVHILKRSGEPLEVRSKWDNMKGMVQELHDLFESGTFSSRLAYSVQRQAPILSGLEAQARKSMLKVLLKRQSGDGFKQEDEWSEELIGWADKMDTYLPHKRDSLGNDEGPAGFTEMADWLVFARFLAQRGGEA
jgi:CRISPR-associated protein Cmr2